MIKAIALLGTGIMGTPMARNLAVANPVLAGNDHSAYLRWLEIQNQTERLGMGEDKVP